MLNHISFVILFLLSTIIADNRGWVHPETGWEVFSSNHMSIIAFNNVYINNEIPESNHTDAIGILYEEQCIGWSYFQESITFVPAIGNDGESPQFPNQGDSLRFFIYDKSQDLILEMQSLESFPNWEINTMPNVQNSIGCQFDIPIDSNGECVELCDYSPNLDPNIDIYDIIFLLNNHILCQNCDYLDCGDINSDEVSNIQDLNILLDIILSL